MNKDWKENCFPGLKKKKDVTKAWQIFDIKYVKIQEQRIYV